MNQSIPKKFPPWSITPEVAPLSSRFKQTQSSVILAPNYLSSQSPPLSLLPLLQPKPASSFAGSNLQTGVPVSRCAPPSILLLAGGSSYTTDLVISLSPEMFHTAL